MSSFKLTNAETGEVTELDLSRKKVSIRKTRAAIRKVQKFQWNEVNGWKSTTQDPEKFTEGSIWLDVIEGPIIEFTDKYDNKHRGILSSWSYSKFHNTCSPVITTTTRDANGIHDKYEISEASITKGELPELPITPKFVTNE